MYVVEGPKGPFTGFDWTTVDGSLKSSNGAPQNPLLFNIYPVRPPWHVAGVDYAVGITAGKTLIDWRTIGVGGVNQISGITISGTVITCDPTLDIVLDSIDFTVNNGCVVQNTTGGSGSLTVTNSKFGGSNSFNSGSGQGVLTNINSLRFFTVSYNLFDLFGSLDLANNTVAVPSTTNGTIITYNWAKNGGNRFLSVGPMSSTGRLTCRFNLLENFGTASGAHLNYMQGNLAPLKVNVDFNTVVQNVYGSVGQCFQYDAGGTGNSFNPTCNNNVFVAHGNSGGQTMGDWVSPVDLTVNSPNDIIMNGRGQIKQNYVDRTTSFAFQYTGKGADWTTWDNLGNIDLLTGNIISPA